MPALWNTPRQRRKRCEEYLTGGLTFVKCRVGSQTRVGTPRSNACGYSGKTAREGVTITAVDESGIPSL